MGSDEASSDDGGVAERWVGGPVNWGTGAEMHVM